MYDFFVSALQYLIANWQSFLIGGTFVVFSLICTVGSLKPFIFNKISNKAFRKSLLALTSVVMIMPCIALWFLISRIDFHYYWITYAVFVPITIVVYWLYENTNLRSLVELIGKNTYYKVIAWFAENYVKDVYTQNKIKQLSSKNDYNKMIAKEVKQETDKLFSHAKDNDLNNL